MKKWAVLFGTGIASMLTTIDFTIVNTSLVPIQETLSASLSELQWIIAAFGIPYCVLLVICGRLADHIGRRLVFYVGIGGFGLASLAAGLSSASWELILARFFQGVFAATIYPCAMALTAEVFPKDERRRALGIYFGMAGIGLALGPVIGGAITSAFNWHWIFLINIPLILISYLICLPSVKESRLPGEQKIDWKGLVLLLIGLSSLVTWITEGPNEGWTSAISFSLLALSIFFLGAYVKHEKKCPYPILPFQLFRKPRFQLGILTYFACNSCMWGLVFLVPLYLQGLLGFSASFTGLLLLIMTATSIFPPTIAGHILVKKGERTIMNIIFTSLFLGYLLILLFSYMSALWVLVLAFLLIGIAWGSGRGVGGLLVLTGHETTANTGMIAGAASTSLNLFGLLLMTISGTVLRFAEKIRFNELLKQSDIQLTHAQDRAVRMLGDPEAAKSALSQFGNMSSDKILSFFTQSFHFGFQISILFLILFTLTVFILILRLIPKVKT